MLVQRVMDFVQPLECYSDLASCDHAFLNALKRIILSLNATAVLSSLDLNAIKKVFFDRWNTIIDTSDDYTRDPKRKANAHWIQFSKDLADDLRVHPLTILIPIEMQNTDPDTLKWIESNQDDTTLGLWCLLLNDDNTSFLSIYSLSYAFSPALSVQELLRIRLKKAPYWEHLTQNIFPEWQKQGSYPLWMLPPLLDLISAYFLEIKHSRETGFFQKQFFLWSKQLSLCPAQDVYFLYSQMISVDGKNVFLIDIFLDFLNKDLFVLKDKVIGIARWLSEYDPSFVCQRKELKSLYDSLKIGKTLTVLGLKERLVILNQDASNIIQNQIHCLLTTLDNKASIDVIVIDALRRLYKQRWFEIIDTNLDYTRLDVQNQKNDPWICLAQLLSPFYLEESYYSFLMPTKNATSLSDLYHCRLKKGALYDEFLGKTYPKFLNRLSRAAVTMDRPLGEIPREHLRPLLHLIDVYCAQGDAQVFCEQMTVWMNELEAFPYDDVQCLYKRSIKVGKKSIYFLDLILDCLNTDSLSLHETIVTLAQWLCDYDASFIIRTDKLFNLYIQLGVGPGLTISHFQSQLVMLKKDTIIKNLDRDDPVFKLCEGIDQLRELTQHKQTIDQEIIEKMRLIFQRRWLIVQGQPGDYTRSTGACSVWIRVAQLLSGAGLIDENYYRVLMPTILHDNDPVTLLPIVDYPLDHFIFPSGSYQYLILLDNSVSQYDSDVSSYERDVYHESQFLSNCNSVPAKYLNAEEHDLLQYANKKFHKWSKLTRSASIHERSISLDTVDALTRLVQGSLCPIGLSSQEIPSVELDKAHKAYFLFYEFYHQLPDEEKSRLDEQMICFNGMHKSFKKLLNDVQKGSCVAIAGKLILKLVFDYVPARYMGEKLTTGIQFLRYSDSAVVGIKEIQLQSRHKRFYDEEEFGLRAQTILLSILTHSFDVFWIQSYTVSVLDCSNQIDYIAKKIFDRLMPMIQSGDFSQYPDVVYSIVIPALNDSTLFTGIWSEKTRTWLQSLADATLFKKDRLFYDSKLLLAICLKVRRMNDSPLMNLFLDDLLWVLTQNGQNERVPALWINIKFKLLLKRLPELFRIGCIEIEEQAREELDGVDLKKLYAEALIDRMTALGAQSKNRLRLYEKNRFSLENPAVFKVLNDATSIEELVDGFIGFKGLFFRTNPVIDIYLNKLKSPILSAHSETRFDSMLGVLGF